MEPIKTTNITSGSGQNSASKTNPNKDINLMASAAMPIPLIPNDFKRIQYINSLIYTLKVVDLADKHFPILENLQIMLLNPENNKLVKTDTVLIPFLQHILSSNLVKYSMNNLYTQSLSLL